MCGITGFFDTTGERPADAGVLARMAARLAHRGPDATGEFVANGVALGFRRLAIVDPAAGNQPMFSEDRAIVSICNGEFYNYPELRRELLAKGHHLQTRCDSEVLPHLYEEYGIGLLDRLDGQFSFALFDSRARELFLARDPFGVNPAYYVLRDGIFIFASEIKALLEHPLVPRSVNLTALDQVLTFPGVVSPASIVQHVHMLPSGHYVRAGRSGMVVREYWDLCYPPDAAAAAGDEHQYVEALNQALLGSVSKRLQADVPVGVYLSGGLDSSLIAGMVRRLRPSSELHTFSVSFAGDEMCEQAYQREVAKHVGSVHHDARIAIDDVAARLRSVVYHAECPLRETYNTACEALSELARSHGVPVILTGQGSDELFAGYIGYRFDAFQRAAGGRSGGVVDPDEAAIRRRLWGDPDLRYDSGYAGLTRMKSTLYSAPAWDRFDSFDALRHTPINKSRLEGRSLLHKRSYLDFKLRLADHLLSDHGDRMAMANAVELRHPFLDLDVVDLARRMSPSLKLHDLEEKYIVKQVARRYVPAAIVNREKFGWFSHGSPALLAQRQRWIDDLLDGDRIASDGYFDREAVARLKAAYSAAGFRLNQPFEADLLAVVLTFNIARDLFDLEPLG